MSTSLQKEPKRESREYSGSRGSCRGTGERLGVGRPGLGTTLGQQRMCFHLQSDRAETGYGDNERSVGGHGDHAGRR